MDVDGFTDSNIMNTLARILLFLLFTSVAVQSEEFDMNPVTPADMAFCEQLKKAVSSDDVEWLSGAVSYPLRIKLEGGHLTLENKDDFKKHSAVVLTPYVKSAVQNQSTNSLFKNWRGVVIGQGAVWFELITEKTNNGAQWRYRIIGINSEDPAVKGRTSKASSEPPAIADEALWTTELVHYDAGSEWAIYPAVEPVERKRMADILRSIHSKDKKARIHSIALGTLFKRADLQSEVVGYLQKQPLFQTSPPPFGKNRWSFKTSREYHKMVSEALLQSAFIKSLDKELATYGWKVISAGMEKLYFTKEDNKIKWHAIVGFEVDDRP
jgi:hypothetical protein